jgi:pilus assembly protein FimV
MLVAMLSRNPDAFDSGNINRLKKGAVLEMPSAATASGTSQAEARQTITAQSKDFNEFRRSLAQGAPNAATPAASRKATGTVQANVEERKPAAAAPDKLTLSKGTVAATGAASAAKGSKEEAIAKDKQSKDAAARTAELSKNIQDLAKLGTTSTTATAKPSTGASMATTTSATGVAVATGATAPVTPAVATVEKATATSAVPSVPVAVASAPAVSKPTVTAAVSATSTGVISTATAVATAPAADTKPVAKATLPPAPVAEPSFVDSLMDNPVTLPAAGGLLALLAGFGFYRMRQRKNASQVDSSFLESRLQPDSFFGASGGQRIDTSESASAGGAGSSSMVYSPSQLDAAGDVDPVAEADVYLAYGRDLQAEEILKEALRTSPTRVAVHAKLMEIYAKRRDTKAFESVAKEAYNVTKGEGTEWEAACALGREIDPGNPLYQGVVTTASSSSFAPIAGAAMATAGVGASAFAASTISQPAMASSGKDADVDFDLDLDFSASDGFVEAPSLADASHATTSPIHVQSTVGMQAQAAVDQPVDLAFDMPTLPQFSLPDNKAVKLSAPDMASFASGLNFSAAPIASTAPTTPMAFNTAPAAPQLDAMEFDMGDLSLDLPTISRSPTSAASMAIDAGITGDPLETKLALAQEFREIGDDDGARSLAQEVAAEAKGDLKARAQRMVADLS